MLLVLGRVWALLFGMTLIMTGNGLHATLLAVRGGIEGFSSAELSVVMSAYFVGFLSGARMAPRLIRRVGHVRVFAAFASFMSATLIAFPLVAEPWAWVLLRVLFGFFMSGVYVTAESWLNNDSPNDLRGKILSAYMLAQMAGMVAAQWLLTTADTAGATLFILASILVSLSFGPILLAATATPAAETSKPMSLRQLYENSPLGTIGLFLLGGVFAAQAGMGAVYGTQAGLSETGIALFVAAMFLGGLVLQFPVGWASDRMDRRLLILLLAALGVAACGLGFFAGATLVPLLVAAFAMGGVASPLYSLLIAYTNDYLDADDMPAASGGLVFIYGLGAIFGPLVIGGAMDRAGAQSFWLVLALLFAMVASYALWRMAQRPTPPVEEMAPYVGVMPASTPLAVETAQAWSNELQERDEADGADGTDTRD
ncbi:MFS transporter [Nitratireductor sp. StC3]|uniref:MFS transporter n=1 Tax=Nitratireductor sp. StC3 TaxID=2126741 RepID=UPI000D0DC8FB|nr:MFS transporter [Nitratireductor sp. StC3]PSM16363.1 MFS transporter [Nitratireductor sp. StC3]